MQVAQWVEALRQKFPTADVVDADKDKLTIKIRSDDCFRYIYQSIKSVEPNAKVSLKPCDVDKKYGLCVFIETTKIMMGWKDWGFDKPVFEPAIRHDENGVAVNRYIITMESMFKAFDTTWLKYNQGRPVKFKFATRKVTPRNIDGEHRISNVINGVERDGKEDVTPAMIWHYITIVFGGR